MKVASKYKGQDIKITNLYFVRTYEGYAIIRDIEKSSRSIIDIYSGNGR